jgi:hypothetical protein
MCISNGYLDEFDKFLKLAIDAHNASREALKGRPNEGHFVNENTLIRIYDTLDSILAKYFRKNIKQDNGINYEPWLETQAYNDGFDAFVTMKEYRDSIVHNQGHLKDDFSILKRDRSKQKYRHNYIRFCASIDDPPLDRGDKLRLSVREPDILLKLIEGVHEFAKNVLLQR